MNIEYKMIRRIRVTYNNEERDSVFKYITKNEYHVTRTGPQYIGFGKYSMTKGLTIAEKEINKSK
jgi:hypothetical protein